MRKWIGKLLILSSCLYHTYIVNKSADLALHFLICLSISLGLDLIENKKVRVAIYSIFAILCFFHPIYLLYTPLIIYNLFSDYGNLSYVLILHNLITPSIPNILLCFLAVYISYTNHTYDALLEESTTIRDGLKEDALHLKKYTDQLSIDKEKDIHIAILSERNRIARQIHDSIGHSLSSSLLQIEALKISLPSTSTIYLSHMKGLEVLQQTLSNGMDDIRHSLHNLYNESFDLEDKLHQLSIKTYPFNIELTYKLDKTLEFNLKFDILSMVKECITNCMKHSNANKLSIKLHSHQGFHSISIKDNGTTLEKEVVYLEKGVGLTSINEIASKYSGFVNINTTKGFNIHLTLMKG